MGGDMHVRNRSATASGLVLLFLMSTLLVVSPTAMADPNVDQMSWYQAQGLSATFDPQTEVTTITWDNIDEFDNRMAELLDATYSVYRHEGPLNSNTLAEADLVATVEACADTIGGGGGTNYLNCRSSSIHPGHVIEYPVPPGENAFVNYTVTTQMGNGTVYAMFIPGDSVTVVGVQESTQAIRTPYNLAGSFDRVTSTTTLTWVPYHILPGGDVIPTEGPDAATILVYRSEDMPITRSNITTMLITNQAQLIANLSAETSTYDVTINAGTQRSAYYAISYYLPNWNGPAFDYVDFRFLSNNAMTESILEDNTPPASPVGVSANFQSDVNNGTAVTWIYWEDALGEVSESYQIYMSGNSFSTIEDPNVTLVGTVTEDVEAFAYTLPTGRFGSAHYCVVTVDSFGVYNAGTTSNSCTGAVYEDAFSSWIKEPTLVEAAYLGQSTTQVTWVDQLGITGERYHIWHANDRLNGAEFIENQTITWLGTVDEGVGVFNVTVPTGMDRDDSFYYVTSEALYGHLTGPAMYTGLVQNVAGPVYEDTKSPRSPDITTVEVFGDELLARITWINEDTEFGERYYIYRHFGDPFAESVVSNLTDEGWEYMFGPIEEGNGLTLVSDVAVEPGLDREVYYAVITEDAYGNVNPTIFEGDNTKRVLEDTLAPDIELTMLDATGAPHNSPSLVSGDYSMLVSLSQDIGDAPVPTITISSADGTAITSENAIMSMIQDNLNNPDKGPVFSIDFAIQSTTAPGALGIVVDVQDASANTNQLQSVDQWFVDAQSPQVTVFSPSSSTDEEGSKYLYGNEVTVTASATDDVRIDRMQYKITYNLDGETLSLPWTDTEEITWMDDNKTAVMSMSIPSGNFAIGRHQVGVQAVDAAGNVRSKTVVFTIDYCNHKADGTTQCVYENEVAGIPDPVEVFPGATDPPYVIIWGLAGLLLLTMVAAFMVVITSMRSPKAKKKGDGDDDADDDWMSEFIGTSQDLDMAAITGTEAKKEPEAERKSLDDDDDEDDPFAVNKPTQKRRRRKSSQPEEDEDDDDEEDGFMEALEEAKPKKRSPPRKRRTVSKSSDDGGASKRRTPPKRRAVKRKSED
tara:strand:- start:3807 stop:7070 length:3264 start_codon:yes stop_codon:yes gene_type:complete